MAIKGLACLEFIELVDLELPKMRFLDQQLNEPLELIIADIDFQFPAWTECETAGKVRSLLNKLITFLPLQKAPERKSLKLLFFVLQATLKILLMRESIEAVFPKSVNRFCDFTSATNRKSFHIPASFFGRSLVIKMWLYATQHLSFENEQPIGQTSRYKLDIFIFCCLN